MPFTVATITGNYVTATGAPATGSVEFTLDHSIQNGNVTLLAGTSTQTTLDASGNISQQLVATTDPGTQPQGALWRVDERVGVFTRSFFMPVPSGGVSFSIESASPFTSGPPSWG